MADVSPGLNLSSRHKTMRACSRDARRSFVAGLHVEQRKVRMDELFPGLELLGFVAFGDGGGEIAFAIMRHAEGELRVEMHWIGREDGAQFLDARRNHPG